MGNYAINVVQLFQTVQVQVVTYLPQICDRTISGGKKLGKFCQSIKALCLRHGGAPAHSLQT